ncbi:MAG: N-acetylmuramoyl-L-alanine amidase [Pseudomonadota bacterium]
MSRVLCLLFCLLAAATAAQAKPAIHAARIGEHPDKTRFVLELTEQPAYRIFTLPDPFRVVIDLPEADWLLQPGKKPRQIGLIDDLRFGLFAPGTSRIVLDVNKPVLVRGVTLLPPGPLVPRFRLVIDLEEITRTAYFADQPRPPVESTKPLARKSNTAVPRVTGNTGEDELPLVVVDAGHGGVDPGAIGASGIYEKDLMLIYAKELARQLEASGRYRVLMTREDDVVVPLRNRVEIAQLAEADLFVSLHANTHPKSSVLGASVYTISSKASDAEAEALAAKENQADAVAGITFLTENEDVREILMDLIRRETVNLSKNYANILIDELGKSTKMLNNSHRYAGFVVLKSASVPSVLVEVGYISNPVEERLMRTKAHQKKVSAALVRSIDRYFTWHEQMSRS